MQVEVEEADESGEAEEAQEAEEPVAAMQVDERECHVPEGRMTSMKRGGSELSDTKSAPPKRSRKCGRVESEA